jgi:hypothetical protein
LSTRYQPLPVTWNAFALTTTTCSSAEKIITVDYTACLVHFLCSAGIVNGMLAGTLVPSEEFWVAPKNLRSFKCWFCNCLAVSPWASGMSYARTQSFCNYLNLHFLPQIHTVTVIRYKLL